MCPTGLKRFPVSLEPVSPHCHWERIVDATRLDSDLSGGSCDQPPLSVCGLWEGHAVLLDTECERSCHPTALPNRAQSLRWVPGYGEPGCCLNMAGLVAELLPKPIMGASLESLFVRCVIGGSSSEWFWDRDAKKKCSVRRTRLGPLHM